MDPNRQQIITRLKTAKNVLVTVSKNPSVDQLAACIGLALFINKQGKHGTAVYSGVTPSTIEFLQPEVTLEHNTDSLRDFIISLDKSKADRLRYKVEDDIVKIFITPYHTSLTEKDLVFSQGDLNTDTVVALGVKRQSDLDQAIVSHGRILHDATVIALNTTAGDSELGAINWNDPKASSLCEMVTTLAAELDAQSIDSQIATALLTGIVAQTARFSNERTSPVTMDLAAKLMGSGANQQLIATNLEEKPNTPEFEGPKLPPIASKVVPSDEAVIEQMTNDLKNGAPTSKPPVANDGSLQVAHSQDELESRFLKQAKQKQPPPPPPPPLMPPANPTDSEPSATIEIPEPESKPDINTKPVSPPKPEPSPSTPPNPLSSGPKPELPKPEIKLPLPPTPPLMPQPPKAEMKPPELPNPDSAPKPTKPTSILEHTKTEIKPPEPDIPKVIATPEEPPRPEPKLPPIIKKDPQESLLPEPPKPKPEPGNPNKDADEAYVSDPLSGPAHTTPILSHNSEAEKEQPSSEPASFTDASLDEARKAVMEAVGSATPPPKTGEDPLAALGIKPVQGPNPLSSSPEPRPNVPEVQPSAPVPIVESKPDTPATNSKGETIISDSSSLEKLLKKSEESEGKKSDSAPPPPVPPPIYPL